MQGDLQHLHGVEVTGEDVGLFTEGAHFHAAGGAALTGVFQRFALAHQFLDDGVGVEDGGEAHAFADDAAGLDDELVGVLGGDLNVGGRLEDAHILDDFQQQVGHVVDAVGAVGLDAADVDVAEVGVGGGFLQGDAYLGRSGLVVELDPPGFQIFLGLLPGEGAGFHFGFVEGIQMLVQLAGAVSVPGVQLGDDAQMDEEVHLQGFVEGAGSMGGDPFAVLGDLDQLGLAGLRSGLGHFPGLFGVTLGPDDHRVAGDVHGLQLFGLVVGFQVVHVIDGIHDGFDVSLEIQQAFFVDLAVGHGMTGGALFHEFGVDAGFIAVFPFGSHLGHDVVADGAAPPIRDDDLFLDAAGLFVVLEEDLVAFVQDLEVLDGVAAQLGVSRRRMGTRAAFADDQLVIVDADLFVFADMLEGQGAQHRSGNFAFVHFVGFGLQDGAFDGQSGDGGHAGLALLLDAVVHAPQGGGFADHHSGCTS